MPGSSNTLTTGERLVAGSGNTEIASLSGEFTFQVETGGSEVDETEPTEFGHDSFLSTTWFISASNTPAGDATFLILQSDGNLVLYRGNGSPVWSSNTVGSGANRLIMQNDGNLVLYTTDGRPVWYTATTRSELAGGQQLLPGQSLDSHTPPGVQGPAPESLIMQGDGNLVFYVGGVANWSSQTFVPGSRAVMQTDGNLVVYTPSNRAVWSSGTFGTNTDVNVAELVSCDVWIFNAANLNIAWSSPFNLKCFG